MKKLTIASMLIASLGATVLTTPAFAANETNTVTASLQQALDANISIAQAVKDAITKTPENAEDIIAAAIALVGADSADVSSILTAATNAGITADDVTAIAIANNVDTNIASQVTAAGNNANQNGQAANSNNANGNAGAGNNNRGGNGNSGGNSGGGGGGGGGAGGISENG